MPDDYSFLSPDSGSRGPREDGFLGRLADLAGHLEDFFRRSTLLALLILSIIAGGLTGLVFAYQAGLTSFAAEVEGLADYRPSEITKVYADDGKTVIGELSLERRIPLASDEIPETMTIFARLPLAGSGSIAAIAALSSESGPMKLA